MLPLETNIKDAYQKGTDDEQNFIQNLSLFLCTFLKEHVILIERKSDYHSFLMEVKTFTLLLILSLREKLVKYNYFAILLIYNIDVPS